jgi:glutaminyl-peptide cyclotransferase
MFSSLEAKEIETDTKKNQNHKMDDDVEMIERNDVHSRSVYPAERVLVPQPLSNRIRRQNCWVGLTFLLFLIIVAISVVGFYRYDEREQMVIDQPIENSNGGELDEDADNDGNTDVDPFANIQNTNDISDLENILEKTHDVTPQKDTKSPVELDETQKWLNATVTLNDGPMFEVIKKISHSKNSFTEGLTYFGGVLYESIGLNGHSSLLVLDAFSGTTKVSYDIDDQYFGEGLTYMNGKLVQLTWQSRTGFVYDTKNLAAPPSTFSFTTTRNEGWGITYDSTKDELIVSDGSNYLHFWDPITMEEKRKVEVIRQNSVRTHNINELEFWRGRVLANIWYEDVIIVINPDTGIVEKEYGTRTHTY